MKILHLSFSDTGGGAARAAYRIHQGLLEDGVDSTMLVVERRTREPSVVRFQPSTHRARRIARALRRYSIQSALSRNWAIGGSQPFSEERSWLGPELAAGLPQCDIVHLHWIAGMVDYGAFIPEVADRVPIVWTLHDMNPFTGGCHYDGNCGRFSDHCGNCPMLKQGIDHDFSNRVFERKRSIFAKVPASRMQIITPSQWLTRESSRSSLLGKFNISTIPYGLNLQVFAPREKSFAREVLGIPQDARVVLFVAQTLRDERKGHRYLMEALESLDNVFLLSLGSGEPSGKSNALHLGFVEQDRLLSMVYSAADVFAATSIEENLPQTVLEAMACGLPVVGFDVGGIPDAVQHGVTGLLVPVADSAQLRAGIQALLSDPAACERMAAQARIAAGAKFSSQAQTNAYRDVYDNCFLEHQKK